MAVSIRWIVFGVLGGVISAPILWIYFKKAKYSRKPSEKDRKSLSTIKLEDGDVLSLEAAKVLSSLIIDVSDIQLRHKAAVTIVHSAAIFQNHVILREGGCIKALSSSVQSFAHGDFEICHRNSAEFALMETVLIAINNLANNKINLPHLQDCIGSVLSLSSGRYNFLPDELRSAALKVLINLSCTDSCFEFFEDKDVQNLFELTKTQTSVDLQLQSLRLLANLSWNDRTAAFILAATIPDSFYFDENCSDDVLLRWLTVLRNVSAKLDSLKLTVDRTKSETSEVTIADLLYGDQRNFLRTQLLKLIDHRDDNISNLAVQLSQNLFEIKATNN